MSQFFEYAGLLIISVWVFHASFMFFMPNIKALVFAIIISCLIPIISYDIGYVFIAVLAPFGVILPAMALQNMARGFGLNVKEFRTIELVIFVILYLVFLCASLGVFTFDPYRFGYIPLNSHIIAIIGVLYALCRQYYPLAVAILLGQVLWFFDIGSSNFFDHISHALLVPIILVCLFKRALKVRKNAH